MLVRYIMLRYKKIAFCAFPLQRNKRTQIGLQIYGGLEPAT